MKDSKKRMCAMNRTLDWWRARHDELMSMAEETCPLYVINEETLNELFFDLLCIEAVDRLLYPLHANSCAKIMAKAFDLGLGFICVSQDEIKGLLETLPHVDPQRILFEEKVARGTNLGPSIPEGVHVVVRGGEEKGAGSGTCGDRDVFVRWDGGPWPLPGGPEKAGVEGLLLSVKTTAPPRRHRDKTLSMIGEALKSFPDVRTLVIRDERCSTTLREAVMAALSVQGDFFERVQDAFPFLSLWYAMPDVMVSGAGVLLDRVVAIGEKSGVPWIRIHTDTRDSLQWSILEGFHRLVNLSRPGSTEDAFQGAILKSGAFIEAPEPVEKGDLVLLTHMGASRFRMSGSFRENGPIPERFLPARRLCLVRL